MSHADVVTPPTTSGTGVHDLVRAQARADGGAPALVAADGSGAVTTYAELLDRVDALAGRLRASGVEDTLKARQIVVSSHFLTAGTGRGNRNGCGAMSSSTVFRCHEKAAQEPGVI
ncbi:MAG: hypothetical protein LH603_19800 [Pseudonocardia sp.]|nr:hypothetical protein [Pseudonocardia sp.]